MKKKIIAIAFSDLHLNDWSKFNTENSRTLNGFSVLHRIAKICDKHKCPALFCGDLFHKAENISKDLYKAFVKETQRLEFKYPRFKCYAISGNHDLDRVSTVENKVDSWVSLLSYKEDNISNSTHWLECIDFKTRIFFDFTVAGVPYLDHNQGLNEYLKSVKTDILLLHTDYPGATDTDGRVVGSTENLNINLLKPFKLVLIGHIHKPQRLGKKIYMVGAPQQQRRTDRDCEMGYMEIYDDFTVKFKAWDDYPKFIDVYDESEIKDDGNYYTVIPKPTSKTIESEHKITKQLTKKQLARRYMKQKGDKNKTRLKLLTKVLTKGEELC